MTKEDFHKPCWSKVISALKKNRILPLIEAPNIDTGLKTLEIIYEAGINAVEIALRTTHALSIIEKGTREFPDLIIGAGSVIEKNQIIQVKKRGASFAVSPGFDPEVGKLARENTLPLIPGVATPTEVQLALANGFEILKTFPISLIGGPKWIKAVEAPFIQIGILWIPTGGINEDNLGLFLKLKSVLACAGSWIAPKERIRNKDFKYIREKAKAAIEISKRFMEEE